MVVPLHFTATTESNMLPTEIRASITKSIIESLNQGTIPWRKPWVSVDGPRTATNFVTKLPYSGINVILTMLAEHQNSYPISYWATFDQFKKINCRVKKGEKGTRIVFYSQFSKEVEGKNGDREMRKIPILKSWSIFNIAQVDGEVAEKYQITTTPTRGRFEDVDRSEFDKAVEATGAEIRYGGDKAVYYRPPHDFIKMPHEEQFHDFPAFAETLLHECCHWTEWRTGWSGTYAEGELRAEIGGCFLATALGLPNSNDLTNHAAYVQNWLQSLENDPKFIFRASAAASKAADFILNFSRPKVVEEVGELVVAA